MILKEYQPIRESGVWQSAAFRLMRAVFSALVFTAVAVFVFSLALTYTALSEEMIPTGMLIVLILAVAVAGIFAARSARSRGWFVGLTAGVCYGVCLYLIAAFVCGGFFADGYCLLLLAVSVFAGAIGGILGINFKNGRR